MKKFLVPALALLAMNAGALGQQTSQKPPTPAPPGAPAAAAPIPVTPANASAHITLDEAIRLALQHNHALQAVRSTILISQADEITANLRPNPTISWDSQFFPLFHPDQFNSDYLANQAQFDLNIGYLFERGKKRQHRLQAAKAATAVVRSQETDSERQLVFNVAQQFIAVLLAESTLDFAQKDLDSFQQTVSISESRFKAGDMSEGDYLKIKLQLLQFQTDVSAAQLAKVQALAALRQLLGFDSVPDNYACDGDLSYETVHGNVEDLKALALRSRPDLTAAILGVSAARDQESLAEANGKRDLGVSFSYTHTAGQSSGALFFNMELPIFDRNQGNIAHARYAVTQAQEQASESAEQVMTDVTDAFENLKTNGKIIQLYQGGYVDQAKQSRDISEYAYKRGAASLLDFLDAERTYRANQLAYRQALAGYMAAVEQMRQAVGTRNLP
ncbi:MAG: TolC family protein [Acidobacteria bacterium]|nr:TolC family protein [Acidobacteriota bacterium]MBS1864323.1 TolC family protein [Acidobacteriota bacterium]